MLNKKLATLAVAIMLLAILLVSSTVMLGGSAVVKPSVTATPLSPAKDYGDPLQYEWDQAGSDEGNIGSSTGPAPEMANVLWSRSASGSMATAMDGMVFGMSGTTVTAYDAFTGDIRWTSTVGSGNASITALNGVFRIDDTYFLTQGGNGISVRRIDNGQWVATLLTPNANRMPGSGTYFAGHYSEEMKLFFNHAYDPVAHQAQVVAHSVADPLHPTIAWIFPVDSAAELLCSGDGMVFWGTTEGEVVAVNATGHKVWQTAVLGGIIQQSAIYYNHCLYTSAVSWQLTCFNGTTGEMIWQAEKGIRAFSAYRGAAGDGMIFESTVELQPYGTIGAWDAATGARLWKQPGYYNIHYATMAYADGKVYGIKCDRGGVTGDLLMPGPSFSCWDAYTGTELWNLPGISFSSPSIAYGNLYGFSGGRLYCIGGEPKDWANGLLGNVDQPRVAVGQQGPQDISSPRWYFQTGGDVYSSPAVAAGRVYVGSADRNLYCLDAYTGEKLWNFTIEHYLRSSPTVANGRVFIGADDGFFYAVDAVTGEQKWRTSAGGFFPYVLDTNEGDARSSPVIVGGTMYCGALDGKLYAINTQTGNVQWTYQTNGPIMGTAAYSNGIIYIASSDGYLYAVNSNGGLAWKSAYTLSGDITPPAYCEYWNIGTPMVAAGRVFIGGGIQYGNALLTNAQYAAAGQSTPSGANGGGIRMFCFNATTGQGLWNQSRAGNTQPSYVPAYVNGYIIAPEFFEVTSMSATNPNTTGTVTPVPDFSYSQRRMGSRVYYAWVGYQIQGSMAYADDLTGPKIYAGSDIGSIYCFNATGTGYANATLNTYSVYTAGGNIAGSPTVWNGRMYVGTTEGILYCFDDTPNCAMSLWAQSNKGGEMWNNETLSISGTLIAKPMMMEWVYPITDENATKIITPGYYGLVPSEYSPALPNAIVQISLTKPDGTNVQLNATTDKDGKYSVDYIPQEEGQWGWVAYYEGKRTPGLEYYGDYSDFSSINVVAAPVQPTPEPTIEPTPTPTPTAEVTPTPTVEPTPTETVNALPMEYIYAIVAVIAIVVIAAAAFFFMKKKKTAA